MCRILGSVVLHAASPDGTILHIIHLVLESSSNRFIGRNFTGGRNILQLDGNLMIIPGNNVHHRISLPLIDQEYHIYLPFEMFTSQPMPAYPLSTVVCFGRNYYDLARCKIYYIPCSQIRLRPLKFI